MVSDCDLMEERDYDSRACKIACMAECLSPTAVSPHLFFSIYVKNERAEKVVSGLTGKYEIRYHVNINSKMFVGE